MSSSARDAACFVVRILLVAAPVDHCTRFTPVSRLDDAPSTNGGSRTSDMRRVLARTSRGSARRSFDQVAAGRALSAREN